MTPVITSVIFLQLCAADLHRRRCAATAGNLDHRVVIGQCPRMTMLAYPCLLDILLPMNHATISVIGDADNDNPTDPDSPRPTSNPHHLIDPALHRLKTLPDLAGAAR